MHTHIQATMHAHSGLTPLKWLKKMHEVLLLLLCLTESYCTCQAHASYLGGTNLKDWNNLQNQLKQRTLP